jgi:predicted Zn-dependent protease
MAAAVMLCLLAGSGCEVLKPKYSLKDRGSSLVDDRELSERGKQIFADFKARYKRSVNTKYIFMLQRVSSKLLKGVHVEHAEWEFVVFVSNTPNAFALPGGKIGITTSLFKYIRNESELALIIGHEIAHVRCAHSSEQMGRQMITNTLGTAVNVAIKDGDIQNSFQALTDVGVTLPHSREHEFEADYFGMKFLAEAGYSPRKAMKFFDALERFSDSSSWDFFSTHPSPYRRRRALEKRLDEFPSNYSYEHEYDYNYEDSTSSTDSGNTRSKSTQKVRRIERKDVDSLFNLLNIKI